MAIPILFFGRDVGARVFTAATTRRIVSFVLVASVAAGASLAALSGLDLARASSEVTAFRQRTHAEVVRATSFDGVPAKALLLAEAGAWQAGHPLPLAVFCHGMSGNWLSAADLLYSLTLRGYAALSVEARGHGSNPAPMTLGFAEAWDVLALLDEVEARFPQVDVNRSGIVGTSMGGVNAMMAYVRDGGGAGRLKCVASLSGPVNVSRIVEFYATEPSAIGDVSLTARVAEKSPTTYANVTFPKNVLLVHGTEDSIVDFRCSADLASLLDPEGNRDDVEFVVRQGAGHEAAGDATSLKLAVAWLDRHVLGREFNGSDVELVASPVTGSLAERSKYLGVAAAAALTPVGAAVAYLVRPSWFAPALPSEGGGKRGKGKWTGWRVLGAAGLAVLAATSGAAPWGEYLLNEVVLLAACVVGLLGVLRARGGERLRAALDDWVKPKAAAAWLASISVPLVVAQLWLSLPGFEDATLMPAARLSPWVPFFAVTLGSLLCGSIALARLALGFHERVGAGGAWERPWRARFAEPLLTGATTTGALLAFLSPAWRVWLHLPVLGLSFPLVPTVAAAIGATFALLDVLVQLLEGACKSLVPGCAWFATSVAYVVGASTLAFFA
ncbi:MAG: hypothetical protein Kow0069_25300 [Promethearchaeota archaeon]